MAQSAITVTPPSPTPPTNFTTFLGTTPPTAPAQTTIDDGTAGPLTAFATQRASADGANFPSVPHEAAGTEVVVTAPGSVAAAPTVAVSVLGSYTTNPNQQHASSMTPATAAALASITPTTAAKAASGTQLITCTGTNFTPTCRIWVNNQERTTTYVSATSLTATVPKSPDAGIWAVDVKQGGIAVPSTRNFTWT
jgi:hypothetical protein